MNRDHQGDLAGPTYPGKGSQVGGNSTCKHSVSGTEHGALRGQSPRVPILPGFSRRVEAKHGCAQELVLAQAQHPEKHLHAALGLQLGPAPGRQVCKGL